MIAEQHPEEAEALARAARIPTVLAELLLARGVKTADDAFVFLNPAAAYLHDPLLMRGMAAAVERVGRAIAAHEPILLYGDYDVDGTTAVVLLKTAIEMLGGIVRFHVPHRIREATACNRACSRPRMPKVSASSSPWIRECAHARRPKRRNASGLT